MPYVPATNAPEGVLLAVLAVGVLLFFVVMRLGRHRPFWQVGAPICVMYAIRLLAVVGINTTGLGSSLRGGDEITFLDFAQSLAAQPLGHGDLPHGIYQLQTVIFALEIKLGFLNVSAIRVVQVGIATLGMLLMIATTYDLAGPKAARFAAWVLAFEPSSIFFNSEIHKEPLMELAAGLVAFGGVWFWKRLDIRGLFICAFGCAIAVETRGYAGWFMACGVVLMVLHSSLRNVRTNSRAIPLVYAIIIAALIVGPTVLAATGGKNLKTLQSSQQANASGAGEGGTGSGNGSNLALESVDYSSRGAIITSLPTKIRDLLLEPYPWQLHDTSQLFGSVGTLYAYVVLVLLIRYAWISRGTIFGRAGPLLYPLLFEMIAYSLTVGNAGTGFRYRSHLVTLGIAALAVLRAQVRRNHEEPQSARTDSPQEQRSTVPVAV